MTPHEPGEPAMSLIGRRAALKSLGLLGGAMLLPRRRSAAQTPACDAPESYNALFADPPMLGRAEWYQPVFRVLEEGASRSIVRTVAYHEVIPLYHALRAGAPAGYPHNDVWFETAGGFVHSSWIVPCREVFQAPEDAIGAGFWGEISVPLVYQRAAPHPDSPPNHPLRWSTVYRVVDRRDDACGQAWYRLEDDVYPSQQWWVEARAVRRIDPAELSPISPTIPPADKRIEVSIAAQMLTAFEYDTPVFATRLSSGGVYFNADGTVYPFPTPWGEHYVQRKTPSRHMIGGQAINQPYNLPGVPWCTYFAATGEAIHGATTHNDFGHPRSHGCLNVAADAAKWLYRWTTPTVGYDDEFYWLPAEDRALATAILITGAG